MIPPVLFTMPDAAAVPGVVPVLPAATGAGFSQLLSGSLPEPPSQELPAEGEGEAGDGDATADLDAPPIALMELLQQPPQPTADAPEPTSAEAPAADAAPAEAEASFSDALPALESLEGALPEAAPLEPLVMAEPEAPMLSVGEGTSPEASLKGPPPAEAGPQAAELAVESGEDPKLQIRPEGLDKLSLRVEEGGDRFDVEIERGVDRSLDIRVVAPPEAIDELSGMESELQRSLEERALRLGSYSAEARDQGQDAEHAGEVAAGEGGAVDGEEAPAPLPEWSMGLLNIRA